MPNHYVGDLLHTIAISGRSRSGTARPLAVGRKQRSRPCGGGLLLQDHIQGGPASVRNVPLSENHP